MSHAKAIIAKKRYKMEVSSGGGNQLIADEPIEFGGENLGFSPDELLSSALASCTAATLRMYADRKQWPLESTEVEVEMKQLPGGKETHLIKKVTLFGPLTEEQRERLLDIAGKCPVHKTLTQPITIETIFS